MAKDVKQHRDDREHDEDHDEESHLARREAIPHPDERRERETKRDETRPDGRTGKDGGDHEQDDRDQEQDAGDCGIHLTQREKHGGDLPFHSVDNTEADHDRLVRLEQRLDGLEARSGQMLSLIAAGTGIFLALLALLAAIVN